MRYRGDRARIATRAAIAESQIAVARKHGPIVPRPAYPRSKNDPLAKNKRAEVERIGAGKRVLWERPSRRPRRIGCFPIPRNSLGRFERRGVRGRYHEAW